MAPPASFPPMVYLNGQILEASEARISVFDRGFIFGDGIYEVMAQIGGHFFYRKAHLDRLRSCLEKIDIQLDVDALEAEIPTLLEVSGLTGKDCLLYIQVTRGVAPRQHNYPKDIEPTVLMYAWAKTLPDIPANHARTISMEDFRWARCDIKMTSLLGNVMANEHAMRNDCNETVLVRNGVVTEASHCNVFFVKDGVVITHPADTFILDGITRQVVLELCAALGIEVREEGYPAKDIPQADEAFLTGTSTQITAIQQLDDHVFFTSEAGPVTRRLQGAFLERKRSGRG